MGMEAGEDTGSYTWPPGASRDLALRLQEGFHLGSEPVFQLRNRGPAALRKEALDCLSSRFLALGSRSRTEESQGQLTNPGPCLAFTCWDHQGVAGSLDARGNLSTF